MPDLKGKTTFVTGAAGFIGANLVRELLNREAVVHAMLRPGGNAIRLDDIRRQLQIHQVDINDAQELAQALQYIQPQFIFNLASPAGHPETPDQRAQLLRTSVLGTANLLEAARSLDFEGFVHFGSSTEYGPRKTPLKEVQRLDPVTFRGVAKASAALLCQQFAREQQRPLLIIRPFSVYGYWEAPTRFIPTAILAALRGKTLHLTQPGFRRDLIFVEDLVEASLLALQVKNLYGKIINIGSGMQYLNEQIVDVIQSATGKKIHVLASSHPASPSDTGHWIADIQRAHRVLNWQPGHPLEEGMGKNVAWFRARLDLYEKWLASLDQT